MEAIRNWVRSNNERFEWGLGVFAVVAAIAVWWINRMPEKGIDIFVLFPVFGLIAFSLMWTHFIMGAVRRYMGVTAKSNAAYMSISMGIVLAMIVLHPALLWFALYQDGLGLPPVSYLTAYSNQIIAVSLGSMSLAIFLAYEFNRWFSDRTWWKYVLYAQYIGMAAIFYHALQLGRELTVDWFMALWWFYGLTFLAVTIYNYRHGQIVPKN